MISKAKIKQIRSLELKKNRDESQCFVAEGVKVVGEMLGRFPCQYLAATPQWAEAHPDVQVSDLATNEELSRAGFLKTPQLVLGIFKKGEAAAPNVSQLAGNGLCLALDCVQNPGNLGTIIRLADWFGIAHIFCSPDTADAFSPKAVQATMGALAHVSVHYTRLDTLLASLPAGIPVYGTFLDGANMYQQPLEQRGIIVMGNEGRGIHAGLEPYITRRLYIPNYASGPTSESLNVAIATAVVCAEFRRRSL